MIKLSFIADLIPVDNFLGLKHAKEYVILKNDIDIGLIEAYITHSEIYIFNVKLKVFNFLKD